MQNSEEGCGVPGPPVFGGLPCSWGWVEAGTSGLFSLTWATLIIPITADLAFSPATDASPGPYSPMSHPPMMTEILGN